MGSEANLRHKTGKLPVQLYRTFFKISIAAAIYTVFCIIMGNGDIKSASLAVAVSVLSAIAYEIVYFVYKSESAEAKSSDENLEIKQLKIILRFFGYLLGLFLLIKSAELICNGNYFAPVLTVIGLLLCQQMHQNKLLSSHLSTFCESLVLACAVITLELMFYSLQLCTIHKLMWLIGVAATVLSAFFAQLFFHFYNCQKHGNKAAEKLFSKESNNSEKASSDSKELYVTKRSPLNKKKAEKARKATIKKEARIQCSKFLKQKTLIFDRFAELCRDLLLICAIFAVFGILISVGSINLEMFDIAVAVIPVLFSIASPILEAQKTDKKRAFDKYDPRISPNEFKDLLTEMFGENSLSEKALTYVTEKMTAKNGLKRYNGEDYYIHPLAVALILLENTDAEDAVIAAALLHDCIEDVDGCTKELLEKEYTSEIAGYVDVLSKKQGINYRERENMQKYLDDIALYPNAAIIKIADRINNMNTLENCVKAEKLRKFRQTRMYYPKLVAKMKATDKENLHFYEFAEKCFDEKKY